MGCDMVVALNQATVQGNTLFGLNHHGVRPMSQMLCRFMGTQHAPDEVLRLGRLTLPQVRRTNTVLGSQPSGSWGLTHGINEHGLAAGLSCWQSKLSAPEGSGFLGTDLVRLTLERSQSARHGLDVLTDLLCRHGQCGSGQPEHMDSIFLLADPHEAFVVETAGRHWAMLQCQQVRAVSDVGLIRQDWRKLAPGLAELAISRGWGTDDGSKLDVAGSLTAPAAATAWPLRRWGKATLALEQQSGDIDPYFLRIILGELLESAAASKPSDSSTTAGQPLGLLASFIALLPPDVQTLPVAWCSCGPSGLPLYFPILIDGELPPMLARESSLFSTLQEMLGMPEHMQTVKDLLDKLQDRFDQQLEEFLEEVRVMRTRGDTTHIARLAGILMQNHCEMLEAECRRLPMLEEKTAAPIAPAG